MSCFVKTNEQQKEQRTYLLTYSEEEIQWEDIEISHVFDIQDSEQVTKGLWLPSILQSKHKVQVSLVVLQYKDRCAMLKYRYKCKR